MNKRLAAFLIVLVLMLHTPIVSAQTTTMPDFAAIDAYVEAEMRADRVPGVALAIVHNQTIVHARGFGHDGTGQPVTAETGFILGSMSKSFTALAIMQLVERGLVELDMPVQHYLPWFRVADVSAASTITLRHLLTHTSGIPSNAPQANNANATISDHVRALAQVQLSNPPGTLHEYASPNYLVLGAVIEQASGQSYPTYIQQHIFAPLDMHRSFTNQDEALRHGMSQGHRYWAGFPVATTLEYEADRMPTAALISSAADLANYLRAYLAHGQFGDTRVLSSELASEMTRPQAPSDDFSYGFGWRISQVNGVDAIHHGGVVPHFRGKMVMLPGQQWGVVVLTNASSSMPLPLAPTSHRMADAIAASLAGQPLPKAGSLFIVAHLAIAIGMALSLWSQLKGLFQASRWWAKQAGRSRSAVATTILCDTFWPLLLIVGLLWFTGLPWSEIMRSTPDLATWLAATAALGGLDGALKLRQSLRQSRSASISGRKKVHVGGNLENKVGS